MLKPVHLKQKKNQKFATIKQDKKEILKKRKRIERIYTSI